MRKAVLWVVPVAVLSACGGAADPAKNRAEKAEALQPGQYEVTSEVTSFRKADEGTPKIDTPQGTRTTRSVCVTDGAAPPPDLFADEGFTCNNAGRGFARGGTLNANLSCRREGLNGEIGYTVSGRFTADTFEVDRQLVSKLSGDGDVVVNSTARGRRTGDCTAAPASNAQANAAK